MVSTGDEVSASLLAGCTTARSTGYLEATCVTSPSDQIAGAARPFVAEFGIDPTVALVVTVPVNWDTLVTFRERSVAPLNGVARLCQVGGMDDRGQANRVGDKSIRRYGS